MNFEFSGRRRFTDPPGQDDAEYLAGFAEHDEKFGATAEVVIRRETAPSRDEAVQLVWPALEEETARALGAGRGGSR